LRKPSIYLFLLVVGLLFGSYVNFASPEAHQLDVFSPKGKVKFNNRSHNFGRVNRGEKLSYRFVFTNTGKGPLSIHGVHASCGCTIADFDSSKIYQQDEVGFIDVELDTTRFTGKLSKTVTVMSNEKKRPSRNLTLTANISEELYSDPPIVNFGDVYSKNGATKIVTVKAKGTAGLVVKDLDYNEDALDVGVVENSNGWQLTVKLKKNQPAGFFKDTIYVANNSRSLSKLPILVRANVKGSIGHSPKYIEFGAVAQDKTTVKTLSIKRDDVFEVTSSKSEMNINGVRVDDVADYLSVVPKGGKTNEIALSLSNKMKTTGSVHGRITFSTSDPNQERFSVDFYAFLR